MQKKIIVALMLSILNISTVALVAYETKHRKLNIEQGVIYNDQFPTFYDWKKACDELPRYNDHMRNPYKTVLQENTLSMQMDRFFAIMDDQFEKISWVDSVRPVSKSTQFQAYAEKLIFPTNAIIAIHGDFHGDVHALNRFIETFVQRGFLDETNPFKIKTDNFYIILLGDYVDRGWYGAEVIYAILRLKSENPDRVFLIRGNHDDINLNTHYDFRDELRKKFNSTALFNKIGLLYNSLPLAFYLGAGESKNYNMILCCHGGIEIGFNPHPLLANEALHAGTCFNNLMQRDGFKALEDLGLSSFARYFKNNKPVDTENGFMWTDFIVDSSKALSLSPRDGYSGTLFEYGKKATEAILKAWSSNAYQMRAIFRAHQHSDEAICKRIFNFDGLGHTYDIGIAKLWIEDPIHRSKPWLLKDIAVVTFSVAPETEYEWPVHSFGELHVATDYNNWRLYVYQRDGKS